MRRSVPSTMVPSLVHGSLRRESSVLAGTQPYERRKGYQRFTVVTIQQSARLDPLSNLCCWRELAGIDQNHTPSAWSRWHSAWPRVRGNGRLGGGCQHPP